MRGDQDGRRHGSLRVRRAAALTLLALAGLSVAAPAMAADRAVTIGSVDRLRVEGAYTVTVRTGAAPALTLSGDRAAIDALEVRSDGGRLSIRTGSGGRPAGAPIAVVLSTPALRGVTVIGAAVVSVGAMTGRGLGEGIDLSVSGTGTLSVAAVDTPRLTATLVGQGGIAIAGGRAGSARLVNNGGGSIEAATVQVGDLVAHQDGAGAIRASARYTAQVIDSGLGSITVAGAPRCTVRTPAGGSVTCGATGER